MNRKKTKLKKILLVNLGMLVILLGTNTILCHYYKENKALILEISLFIKAGSFLFAFFIGAMEKSIFSIKWVLKSFASFFVIFLMHAIGFYLLKINTWLEIALAIAGFQTFFYFVGALLRMGED